MVRRGTHAWTVGRLAGAALVVRPSLLVMGALLVLVFAPQFATMTEANGYVVAFVFVVALYVSITIHEVAHLVTARFFGMSVPSIELHLMGGQTNIEGRSRSPRQEFATAFAGPLASALIGVVCLGVLPLVESGAHVVLWSLGVLNLLVAAFNLLPSPPMDGGRLVRALGWAIRGTEQQGIRLASACGRVTAVALAVGGALLIGFDGPTDLARIAVVLVIAWFLWTASTREAVHGVRAARVDSITATMLARTSQPPAGSLVLHAGLRGRALLVAMAENPAPVYALVDDTGTVIGSLHAEDVDRAYREAL